MKYRYKRPSGTVEAVQYTANDFGDNPFTFRDEPTEWLQDAIKNNRVAPLFKGEDYWYLCVNRHKVIDPDGWIVLADGEVFGLTNEEFQEEFEEIPEDTE